MARPKKSQEPEISTVEVPLNIEEPSAAVETVKEVKQEEIVPETIKSNKEDNKQEIKASVAACKAPTNICIHEPFLHGGPSFKGLNI